MGQHTPGPWTLKEDKPDKYDNGGFQVNAEDTEQLAYVWNESLRHGTEEPFGAKEGEANARLIAAAPELLEALERLLRVASVELTGKRDDVLDQARAAVAKAKGE